MPRRARHWVPEGIYHLTIRGNNREPIFLAPADYEQYFRGLVECRTRRPFRLVAYCLMSNHVHLVLQAVPPTSLSDIMHDLSLSYTRYFNARYGRVGQLYQGRFYSSFIDRDAYLLEVTRYVHLNPVRAQLVRHPAEYSWSSYPSYVGRQRPTVPPVDSRLVLGLLSGSAEEQPELYREFVEALATAQREAQVHKLERLRLVPSRRWFAPLPAKVPGTF